MAFKSLYTCIAFFDYGVPKKWRTVDKLDGFTAFLNREHSSWLYFNVYDKKSKKYLTRFYPHSQVPANIKNL